MSIQGEIGRVNDNVHTSYTAVEAKGGTLPEAQNSANLASAVSSIPQTTATGGNPIGTVISFMGTQAPDSYLICDGKQYSVADYPDLASLFTKQFGKANYFGGNGTTTFAVPDMRNLFLRGYHGSAEQLSGNIGAKQDATEHINIYITGEDGTQLGYCSPGITADHLPKNVDKKLSNSVHFRAYYCDWAGDVGDADQKNFYFTSRPANMAVLYCIKAV